MVVVNVWCSDSDTWIDDTHSNALRNLLSRLNETEVLRTEETQGLTDKRDALPTVLNNAAWMN